MNVLIIGFSGGSLGKSRGAEKAPLEIHRKVGELFLSEDGRHSELVFDEIQVNGANIEETNKNILDKVMQKGASDLIVLGGDHSITYSCFKAFAEKHENPGIVVFDAHPDCENRFSPPTHEDYLRMLIEDGLVKPENVALVGVRSWHKNEKDFIDKHKLKVFSMKELFSSGCEDVCDAVMAVARAFGALYVSVDIDVLDPAFAPGVAYPEPGGLMTRQLIYFIQRLKLLKNLRMADIVEVIPGKDVSGLTVAAASKVLKELC